MRFIQGVISGAAFFLLAGCGATTGLAPGAGSASGSTSTMHVITSAATGSSGSGPAASSGTSGSGSTSSSTTSELTTSGATTGSTGSTTGSSGSTTGTSGGGPTQLEPVAGAQAMGSANYAMQAKTVPLARPLMSSTNYRMKLGAPPPTVP